MRDWVLECMYGSISNHFFVKYHDTVPIREVVFNILTEAMTDEMILKFVKIIQKQLEIWKVEF